MDNFLKIKAEDQAILIATKQEVEDAFEAAKWDRISEAMVNKGTEEYDSKKLRTVYKNMMLDATNLPLAREILSRHGKEDIGMDGY